MPQGVAGYVEPGLQAGFQNDFFKVVLHGTNGQAVSFFRDKQGVAILIFIEECSHGKIFRQDQITGYILETGNIRINVVLKESAPFREVEHLD